MAWDSDDENSNKENEFGSIQQRPKVEIEFDQLTDLVSKPTIRSSAGKSDPPWLIELAKTIRKALIGGPKGTDKKLLKTLIHLGIEAEDNSKHADPLTQKRDYSRRMGGIIPGSIIRFTYRHKPWRVAPGSKMTETEIRQKMDMYEQFYNKHRQELAMLYQNFRKEMKLLKTKKSNRATRLAVVRSYKFTIDLKHSEIKRDLRERRRYTSYLVPGALARIPKTWDNTRYRNVLILNPRHNGKLHGIALDKLNPAQQEVIVRAFDPVEILKYSEGKYDNPITPVERLTKDIFDRLDGNPLLKVKDKHNFYVQFVRPLLKSYGDVYRQFFVNRMHGVSNVSAGQGGIGPEQRKLSNVSQSDMPLFKRLEYMMKTDAPKDIRVNQAAKSKFRKLMTMMSNLLKISDKKTSEDDWEPWMGTPEEAKQQSEQIKKERIEKMKKLVKQRLHGAPETPDIRAAQAKMNKLLGVRWKHEAEMKTSYVARALGEMEKVKPEWTEHQKNRWEAELENAQEALNNSIIKVKEKKASRLKLIKGRVERKR
jgi:hypothetical protein